MITLVSLFVVLFAGRITQKNTGANSTGEKGRGARAREEPVEFRGRPGLFYTNLNSFPSEVRC